MDLNKAGFQMLKNHLWKKKFEKGNAFNTFIRPQGGRQCTKHCLVSDRIVSLLQGF